MIYQLVDGRPPDLFNTRNPNSYKPRLVYDNTPDGSWELRPPKRISWLTDIEALPDIVFLQCLLVSRRIRDIIEGLDPGIHHFHAVRVRMKSGVTDERYLLVEGRKLDAVSREHTNWREFPHEWSRPPNRGKRLVLDARVIGDAHLWLQRKFGQYPLISNELANAIVETGASGFLLKHFEETDSDGNYEPPPPARARVYVLPPAAVFDGPGVHRGPILTFLDGDVQSIGLEKGGKTMPLWKAAAMGHRLDPERVPTRAVLIPGDNGEAPDLMGGTIRGMPVMISERARILIERFAQDPYQFFPIELEDAAGVARGRWHIMVPLHRIQAMRKLTPRRTADGIVDPRLHSRRWVVLASAVAGRQIWSNSDVEGLMVSSDVADIIERDGWRGIHFNPIDVF